QALNEEQEETSLAHHAVLFAGERFDFETAEITDEGETSWFNWGCAGSSAAKLHLTGHTSAAALHMPAVEPASHDLKQTVLYAYTATYCPGAPRMTEPGHPLRLAEVREVLSRDGNVSFHPQASGTVEGIWGPNGLECLSHPRLENLQPGIWDDIAANCPLIPPCDDRATVVANDMSKNLLDVSTPVITFNLSDDSCQGGCGSASAGACSCALGCAASGTCCDDYADVCSPLPAAPSCAHDECIQGATLTSACDPCVTSICAVDPYCCSTYWDSICVGEVSSVCGEACP
ncbi:MAG: hypothetical protein KUG77_15270, partial [Nannocystaceae bacterium]|nr:hypothetical protein [Nannocystaceae bacterium]